MEQNASYEAITKEFQKCQQDNDFLQIGKSPIPIAYHD